MNRSWLNFYQSIAAGALVATLALWLLGFRGADYFWMASMGLLVQIVLFFFGTVVFQAAKRGNEPGEVALTAPRAAILVALLFAMSAFCWWVQAKAIQRFYHANMTRVDKG